MPAIDLRKRKIDHEAMEKIPREFLEKHQILPLLEEKGKVRLATAQPIDFEVIEEVQFMTNCLVETALAPREDILKAIEEYFSLAPHERKARAREAARAAKAEMPPSVPKSPHLAEVLAEILMERGLVTREEIDARLKTREF